MKKQPKLVHYVSPFGSPAWMSREQAEKYRAEDERHYEEYYAAERAGAGQGHIDAPRIEVYPK